MTGILFMTGNTKVPFEDSPALVLPTVYAHSFCCCHGHAVNPQLYVLTQHQNASSKCFITTRGVSLLAQRPEQIVHTIPGCSLHVHCLTHWQCTYTAL